MRQFIKAVSLLAALSPMAASAQSAVGTWNTVSTADGHLEVKVAPCGPALCGTIIRAINPQGQAGEYPHIGRKMIWDMRPDGAGQWSGGKIWDPRNNRTFNSKMKVEGGNLSVSGCVLGICQAQTWRPAN